MKTYDVFIEVLKSFGMEKIAEDLFVHKNTLKRWIEQKKTPDLYKNDLNRMLGNKYLFKENFRENDQFFTTPKTSEYCYQKTLKILQTLKIKTEHYIFIEPSAGCGNFYKIFPKKRRLGVDIAPKGFLKNEIIKSNYLDFEPPKNKKYIVMGNPPFGLRGNLALRFINHSYTFADVVAFILPPLFQSTGKGVPMKRIKGYELAHSEKLPLDSFAYPDGKKVSVATIFQVWVKINTDKIQKQILKTCKSIVRVYSLSDGGTPSSTRNKKMLNKCDVYLPSTCFSGMRAYQNFELLPHRRGYGIVFYKEKEKLKKIFFKKVNWEKVAFLSTNSAKNLRTDLIENEIIKRGYYDK